MFSCAKGNLKIHSNWKSILIETIESRHLKALWYFPHIILTLVILCNSLNRLDIEITILSFCCKLSSAID